MHRTLYCGGIAAAVASCSLFTSLSGLSDGEESSSGSVPDAGADAAGDATQATDGGGGNDASSEAAVGRFCANTDAGFCEDFDDPSDPKWMRWDRQVDNGTSLASAEGFSLPSSLQADTPAVASGSQLVATLMKSFGNVKRSRIAYRFRVDARDGTGQLTPLNQIDCVNAAGERASVRLQLEADEAFFSAALYPDAGSNSFPQIGTSRKVPLGGWHSVEMSLDWTASPAKVSITYDDDNVVTDYAVPGATFGPGALKLSVGIFYSTGPSAPTRVRVDDVLVWTE